jgi:hypothetical protein
MARVWSVERTGIPRTGLATRRLPAFGFNRCFSRLRNAAVDGEQNVGCRWRN